jgi:6-phosphogluconate dehydrogenase
MVPPGTPIEDAVRYVGALLSPGDVIVAAAGPAGPDDGPRARRLAERGVGYLDCAVFGGIGGNATAVPS